MTITISRRYHFESAHHLPMTPEDHKCHRIHGHNYKMDVVLCGPLSKEGWLIDFWDLDEIVKPLVERVDHRLLNDIRGLDNPTAETIACWFMDEITNNLRTFQIVNRDANQDVEVLSIRIYETDDAYAAVEKST